jgi:hypothetical protein
MRALKVPFLILLSAGIAQVAMGSLFSPSQELSRYPASEQPPRLAELMKKSPQKASKKRRPSNLLSDIRSELFAKLRPVERDEAVNYKEAEKILRSKTTPLDQVYGADFEKRMRNEYLSRVAPLEKKANDPFRRAQPWELAQYDDSRRSMADWTAKEALNKQWQDFFRGADRNSAPMKVMSVMHSPDEAPTPKSASTQDPAHRSDLTEDQKSVMAKEEPPIPTRLKTNLNPIKTEGQVVLQNPIVTTGVKGSRGEVGVEMNRAFKAIGTEPKAQYGVKAECLQLNLNQKITDRISLNLEHAAYTGEKRGPTGEKLREAAKVMYSLGF